MTWTEKMKEWGGGDVSFLSEDGEVITFVVIGEPVLIEGKFRGQETKRIGAPIITEDGFTLLTIGKRTARRLSKYEKDFAKCAFDVIRHGEPGDTKATYEIVKCQDAELEKRLFVLAKKGVSQTDIDEAIEAAREIANG